MALAVGRDIDYVKVEHKGENLILARARLSVLDGDYSIIEEMKGSKLLGKEYERIFDYIPVSKKGFYVIHGDFVSTEDGSGIVHIAPAFGEDDYNVGREYDLPVLQPVDKSGNFTKDVTDFAGKFVKDADLEIIDNLKGGKFFIRKKSSRTAIRIAGDARLRFCIMRAHRGTLRRLSSRAKMVELNKKINWVPPEVGTGRFGNWLEENKDWALSRDRFWGTPLNIWVCQNEKCGHLQSIGSVEELRNSDRFNLAVAVGLKNDELDLHKPFVDAIILTCEKCGSEMKRTPELIDVWFDSGSMPFAQYHYPFENKEWFEETLSRRLHFRRNRPDPRLVLLDARNCNISF